MNELDKQELRQMMQEEVTRIAKDEIAKARVQATYGVSLIPYHTHNQIDSPGVRFISLSDVPNSYNGQAGKVPAVNSTENALEFIASSASPGGSNHQLQYNNSGAFGGTTGLNYNSNFTAFSSPGIQGDTASGAVLSGGDSASASDGGTAYLAGGNNTSTGKGGEAFVGGGNGAANDGGVVFVEGGAANSGNHNGGNVNVLGGVGSGSGHAGDVLFKNGNISTSAAGGFIVIPTCAGTPTGTPTTNGSLVYDVSNNKLYVYNGAWKSVTLT